MKNIFYILLLLPTIIFAQYPSNSGQKITLGEQTTADGLVYRGLAADTTRKPSVDTMAFILLDTNTNIIWQYKKAVNNAWTRVGGSISSGLTGVLPVANGGTGSTSYISGAIPYSNGTSLTSDTSKIFFDNTNKRLGINTSVPEASFDLRKGNGAIFEVEYTAASGGKGVQFIDSDDNESKFQIISGTSADNAFIPSIQVTRSSNQLNAHGVGVFYVTQVNDYIDSLSTNAATTYVITKNNGTTPVTKMNLFVLRNANNIRFTITHDGKVGLVNQVPTARLHIPAGTNVLAPLKFNSGVNLETPEVGAMEFSNIGGTNKLYISPANNLRKEIAYTDFTNASGTLPVANGGTGITTFTSTGRIPYASSATALTTNSNLLYDGTRLRVNQVAIGDTSSNTVGITNLLSLSGGSGAGFTLKSSYDSPILRSFTFLINAVGNVGFWNNNLSSYAYFINNSNNFLGLGNVAPTERLHVVGNGLFTGSVTANSLSLTTPLSVANGGTGIIEMPAGYILHGDGTSVDTSLGLFFNRSTSSLGVNTNNPAATIESIGELRINGVATGNGLGVFRLKGAKSNVNGFRFEFDNSNNTTQLINFYSGPMIFGNANAEDMRLSGAGELNIGYGATDNGAYPLQVNGQIFATNATIATSDEKFKENITPLTKGLEIVNKLKPVTFNFISDTENNFSEYEEVGFIAQDVDRALSTESFSKSIVKSADDSEPTSTMGLATQNLIPILVKAIQEQQAFIKALEQRILTLENK